eukprot:Selendium_serpulae@DN8993_c0_g1_i1.p1
MGRSFYCCNVKRNYSVFCCCCPLALAALVYSLVAIWMGAWDIYTALIARHFPDFPTVCSLVSGCIFLFVGIFAIFGIIIRKARCVQLLSCGLSIVLFTTAVLFTIAWVNLIIAFNNGYQPTTEEIVMIVLFTAGDLLFFVSAYYIAGLIASLSAVLAAGGTGWELKDYVAISDETEYGGIDGPC